MYFSWQRRQPCVKVSRKNILERKQQMQILSLSELRTEPCSQRQHQKEQGSEPHRHWEKFSCFLKCEGSDQRAPRGCGKVFCCRVTTLDAVLDLGAARRLTK